MESKFVFNGYSNIEKEIRKRIQEKYQGEMSSASFLKKLKIKRLIDNETMIELIKLKNEISSQSVF